MMMGILDGFQKAYSVDFGPLNILRAAALHGAHFISPLKEVLFLMHQGNRNCHYSLEKHSKLFLPEDINGLDFCTSCSNEYIFLFHQSCTGTNFLISSNVQYPVSMTSGGCAGGCTKLQVFSFYIRTNNLFVFINYCFITSSLISI